MARLKGLEDLTIDGVGDLDLIIKDASYGIVLGTNNTARWKVSELGHYIPQANAAYDIGSATAHVSGLYVSSIFDNTGGDLTISSGSLGLQFQTGGVSEWYMASGGTFRPNTHLGADIGTHTLAVNKTFTANLYNANGFALTIGTQDSYDVSFVSNNTIRWHIFSTGVFAPQSNGSYDIGSDSLRIRSLFYEDWLYSRGVSSANDWLLGAGGASYTYAVNTNNASNRTFSVFNNGAGNITFQVNGTTMNVPFTGTHIYDKDPAEVIEEGDAVKLVNRKLVKCAAADDQACIGIFVTETVTTAEVDGEGSHQDSIYDSFGAKYDRVYDTDEVTVLEEKTLYHIAACGDSKASGLIGAKVCDEGGAVVDGDLLCTSSKAGFLMKQTDDIVRAKTVAQARESVSFDGNGEATGVYVYLLK